MSEEAPLEEQSPPPPPPPPSPAPPTGRPRKTYKAVSIPTPEQLLQEDLMNNCFTRSVVAAVMGAPAGLLCSRPAG